MVLPEDLDKSEHRCAISDNAFQWYSSVDSDFGDDMLEDIRESENS